MVNIQSSSTNILFSLCHGRNCFSALYLESKELSFLSVVLIFRGLIHGSPVSWNLNGSMVYFASVESTKGTKSWAKRFYFLSFQPRSLVSYSANLHPSCLEPPHPRHYFLLHPRSLAHPIEVSSPNSSPSSSPQRCICNLINSFNFNAFHIDRNRPCLCLNLLSQPRHLFQVSQSLVPP